MRREYVVILPASLVWSLLTLTDVGRGLAFDEKADLNVACENYVMLRDVDQVAPPVSRYPIQRIEACLARASWLSREDLS